MHKGWLKIEGVQDGERTLDEQMVGLDRALSEARGRAVLDLGAAEGLIGLKFAQAGATVTCIECNPLTVAVARDRCGPACNVIEGNLNSMPLPAGRWDIVLALAILHKLADPARMIRDIAAAGARLVVVRLPAGSSGMFRTKNYGTPCDVNAEFSANGFSLESATPGPRGEIVQYWRLR